MLLGWESYDKDFVLKASDGAYVVRQKNLAFSETFHFAPLVERQNILLLRVLGHAADLGRNRPLGFLLLYSNQPIVSSYYTYVSVSYSPVEQIGSKEIQTLFGDNEVVLLKIGHEDHFFGWRRPTKEHYSSGSGGVVHRDQDGAWKDGF